MPPKKNVKAAKVKAKQAEAKKNVSAGKSKSKSPPPKKSVSKAKSKGKSPSPSPKVSKSKKTPVSPSKQPKGKGKRDAPVGGKRDEPSPDKKIKKTKSEEQIVKVVTKGGAAVDSFVPNKQSYRVLQKDGKNYTATLNQSNLDHNNNKFYIIQVLVHETNGSIYVWNRWGRVGVPGQNALKGPMPQDAAIRDYASKLNQKTAKGNYRQIEIKYDDDGDDKKPEPKKGGKPDKKVQSKMDQGLQKLISLIFDVGIMNNTMKEIGYDAKRMPLGKLGEGTIKEAYSVLSSLSDAIKRKDTSKYKELTSKFYTLIPHDFGFKNMMNFILDNDEKVKQKIKMLQTISDMKITSKLLDQKADDNSSILDQNYKKLGCKIKTLDTKSSDYKLLQEFFNNTKGDFENVKIGQIYEIQRPDEFKEYNTKIGNNMLLWHGSRISNFVGILSQGLRIAPPQAPASGYLFGKGIYLADMAEKSIHYCRSYGSDHALILLIEGAIGKPNVLLNTDSNAKAAMEKNKKDSTKCYGSKAPPQSSYVKLKNITVPAGKAVPTGSGSYMGHNQFIVYNKNQARIRYIMRMDMKNS